ncbi:Protein of unknown function [Pyronema omphalodes CBS 100304]|uniref:Uncharacterized protein n=1 Tax=Pyronema omphalodes (strain CBS 100304) TaxID=1076935 RepID=U4LEE5_PYROM|nr:Protein of unknown function [Pyronema omphalodes CBS 100304]
MTGVKFDVWLSYVTQALASKSVGHPTILISFGSSNLQWN